MTIESSLDGVDGANPLGFMACLGLFAVLDDARIWFRSDGTFRGVVRTSCKDIPAAVETDARAWDGSPALRLSYEKKQKSGTKRVADLKAPPEVFRRFAEEAVRTSREWASYAAAMATTIAVDGRRNTKPTAFHFTAANQEFLKTVQDTRRLVTAEWASASLFVGKAGRPGGNLRWDPSADRNAALMAKDPNVDGTSVDATLEWLAFRGLALLPSYPVGTRIRTTGVERRGADMVFSWPLWSGAASINAVRSLLQVGRGSSQLRALRERGVFAVCSCAILRSNQGFGNFSPANVESP